jgi:hypothetical protein
MRFLPAFIILTCVLVTTGCASYRQEIASAPASTAVVRTDAPKPVLVIADFSSTEGGKPTTPKWAICMELAKQLRASGYFEAVYTPMESRSTQTAARVITVKVDSVQVEHSSNTMKAVLVGFTLGLLGPAMDFRYTQTVESEAQLAQGGQPVRVRTTGEHYGKIMAPMESLKELEAKTEADNIRNLVPQIINATIGAQ